MTSGPITSLCSPVESVDLHFMGLVASFGLLESHRELHGIREFDLLTYNEL